MSGFESLFNEIQKMEFANKFNLKNVLGEGFDSNKNLYQYVKSIPDQDRVVYGAILVFAIYFANKINITFKTVAGICIGVIIVLYLSQRSKAKVDNFNEDMEYRLEAINLISNRKHFYFHTDPDIIDLFSSVTDLRNYGTSIYDGTLKNIDLFLKLEYQSKEGLRNCKYNLDVAKELRNKILNNWASLGYAIEGNRLLIDKHTTSLKTLKIILSKHINDMITICNKEVDELGIDYNRNYERRDVDPSPYDDDSKVDKHYKLFV